MDALSDVGGGFLMSDIRHSLARIPLRWMIRECFIEHTGIIFDAHMVNQVGLDIKSIHEEPKPLSSANLHLPAPEGSPRSLPKWVFEVEAQEELSDASSPIYDPLRLSLYWNPLEWVHRKFLPRVLLHRRRGIHTVPQEFTKKDDDDSGKSRGSQLV